MASLRFLFLSTILTFTVLSNFTTAHIFPNAHMIRVYNKAWFLANVRIDYELYNVPFKYPIQLPAVLGFNEQATFFVPETLPLGQRIGIVFTADAIGGVRIFSFKVPSLPLCVHIWGTTLLPYWTFIDCSKFIS